MPSMIYMSDTRNVMRKNVFVPKVGNSKLTKGTLNGVLFYIKLLGFLF